MSQEKTFALADVLSCIPGYLVSRRHMDAVYDVLNFMTGDNLFTHQLPRALEQVTPCMIEQHPWLADVQVPAERDDEGRWIESWVAEQIAQYGATVALTPLPAALRVVRDPMAELVEMVGPERVIGVEF